MSLVFALNSYLPEVKIHQRFIWMLSLADCQLIHMLFNIKDSEQFSMHIWIINLQICVCAQM